MTCEEGPYELDEELTLCLRRYIDSCDALSECFDQLERAKILSSTK